MKNLIIWCWKHCLAIRNWLIFLGFSAIIVFYTFVALNTEYLSKKIFLSNDSTAGHYQIEEKCELCHSAFNDVPQASCVNCHGQELKLTNDSHSVKKFRDPRNADDLDKINVLACVTCHAEHVPDATRKMGVTVASDFCVICHADISKERPTHKDLPINGCSKCHNYHNNSALYEKFLVKHETEKNTKSAARISETNFAEIYTAKHQDIVALTNADTDFPEDLVISQKLILSWQADVHAKTGINCKQCHNSQQNDPALWSDKPTVEQCQACHKTQAQGFLSSKHGMRLKQNLPPMTPGDARISMKSNAVDKSMDCNACHTAHDFNTTFAAIDACLNCHDDKHSINYKNSAHYTQLVEGRLPSDIKTSGVSCASCHMPRKSKRSNSLDYTYAEHNQNINLRPNQQMARDVCMSCHSLTFSLDALADDQLVKNNFNGLPNESLKLMEMIQENNLINQRKRGVKNEIQ